MTAGTHHDDDAGGYADLLAGLRRRADEDFADPQVTREPGRHRLDLLELGLRCSLTRALYPNRPGGRDLYVLTVSKLGLQSQPGAVETQMLLADLFGAAAGAAEERPGGPLVRMFRVPAGPAPV